MLLFCKELQMHRTFIQDQRQTLKSISTHTNLWTSYSYTYTNVKDLSGVLQAFRASKGPGVLNLVYPLVSLCAYDWVICVWGTTYSRPDNRTKSKHCFLWWAPAMVTGRHWRVESDRLARPPGQTWMVACRRYDECEVSSSSACFTQPYAWLPLWKGKSILARSCAVIGLPLASQSTMHVTITW